MQMKIKAAGVLPLCGLLAPCIEATSSSAAPSEEGHLLSLRGIRPSSSFTLLEPKGQQQEFESHHQTTQKKKKSRKELRKAATARRKSMMTKDPAEDSGDGCCTGSLLCKEEKSGSGDKIETGEETSGQHGEETGEETGGQNENGEETVEEIPPQEEAHVGESSEVIYRDWNAEHPNHMKKR